MGTNSNGIPGRAMRGERDALELLVRKHYGVVWRSVFRFTRDREAADSLAQETFLRALGSLSGFRGECRLSSWLVRIGLNLAMNENRRRKPAPLPDVELTADAPGPEDRARANEARDLVRGAIRGLPEELSRPLLLTFFGGISHAEAGKLLGCAEGTVSWRVHEAKKKLREALPDGL